LKKTLLKTQKSHKIECNEKVKARNSTTMSIWSRVKLNKLNSLIFAVKNQKQSQHAQYYIIKLHTDV